MTRSKFDQKAYYQANRERLLAKARAESKANPGHRRAYYEANKDLFKAAYRKHSLRTKYGITVEEYDAMYISQSGKCAICKTYRDKWALYVDHNHKTGKVRALLCNNCNSGIGFFSENQDLLRQAIEYLDVHNG